MTKAHPLLVFNPIPPPPLCENELSHPLASTEYGVQMPLPIITTHAINPKTAIMAIIAVVLFCRLPFFVKIGIMCYLSRGDKILIVMSMSHYFKDRFLVWCSRYRYYIDRNP